MENFTDEQAAKVAEFEAAPDAEESLRERVARALFEEPVCAPWRSRRLHDGPMGGTYGLDMREARRLADVALAVIRGHQ